MIIYVSAGLVDRYILVNYEDVIHYILSQVTVIQDI
jgi:hypothetical protein